jgi:hypothetical protein
MHSELIGCWLHLLIYINNQQQKPLVPNNLGQARNESLLGFIFIKEAAFYTGLPHLSQTFYPALVPLCRNYMGGVWPHLLYKLEKKEKNGN